MGSLVLFLTISCIVALHRSNPRAEGSPNITLMKKYNETWCIAQGEDAFSGLSWVSPTDPSVTENGFQTSNNMKQDCEVMRGQCKQWRGWSIQDSLEYPMPEVLDYRWNSLTLAKAEKDFNRNNGVPITSSKEVLELTLSILGKQDAYIYLCESELSDKCYWIIIGGWVNKFNAIRQCTASQCRKYNEVTGRKEMSPLISDEWIHIRVKFDKTKSELKVFLENQEILDYRDNSNSFYDIKYLNVRSYDGEIAYFRYHFYSYFWASRDKPLVRQYYTPSQKRVCWSIVYSIDLASQSGYLEVKLEYKNNLYQSITKKLEYTQYKWKHKKVEFTLEKITEVRIVITGRDGDYFAVGGIMQCNPDGDSRKSTLQINGITDVKCQSLEYPEQKLEFRNPHSITDCGNDCTLNCKMFDISSMTDCRSTVICKKIGDVENACFCSSGFTGQYCTSSCGGNLYGVDCMQKCGNCLYGNKCDEESGRCYNGCEKGYRVPFCKRTYPYLKNAPSSCTGTTTSITVTVDNFETLGEGRPVKYILQYTLSSDVGQWTDGGTYDFNIPRSSVIQNLKPGMKYQIRAVLIDESNNQYSGKGLPYRICSTTCDHPTQENIKIQASTRSLTVNWQVGGKNYPCPNPYQFIVERYGKTFFSDNVKSVPFNVNGLDPFNNYTWRLLYDNDELYSNIIQTMEDVPSGVESLRSSDVSQITMNVVWKRPTHENGIVRFYRVTYIHKFYLICPNENQSSHPKYENTTLTSLTLQNLEPYSRYTITVEAYTVGYGAAVSYETDTLGYDILKVPPKYYEEKPMVIEQTSVAISFTKPEDCSSIQGPIKGYELQIEGKSDWVKTYKDKTDVDFHNYRTVRFDNLKPFSNYSVSIVLKGEKGPSDPQYALHINFRTQPGVPGRVENAIAYSYGANWIHLRWGEPYPPTGEIEYYVVVFAEKKKQVDNNAKCELYEGMICGKIEPSDGLTEHKQYNIKISAKNKDINSPGVFFDLQATTEEKAPSSPVNITAVALSAKEIKVTWKHPSETRGKLKNFKLQLILTSSGLKKAEAYNKIKNKDVTRDEKSYTSKIDDLLPASEYSVSVYGVTVSEGDKAYSTVRTPIAAPKLGTHLQLKEDSISDTSFQVIIPAADEFLTKQSAYIIIVTSEDEVTHHEAGLIFKNEAVKQQILMEANVKNDKYSWVAAEIQPESEKIFTIGDNKTQTSGGYYIESPVNVPLVMGGMYQVTLVGVNQWQDNCSISFVKLEKSVISGIGPDESNYVALWVILVLLLICIPVVLFYILKRRKNLKKEGDQLELKGEDALSGNSQNGMGDGVIIPDMESEEMPDEPILPPSQRFSRWIAIDDLEQYVKSGLASGELQRQHALFPRGQTRPWDYGQLPKNKSKNRYGKLAAYDETRVILKKLPDDPFSDYINANYIDGYKSPKFYIATQGPKRNTVVDFWRMIWQENVHVIAMLANIFEDGKVKCEKYWPELGQEFIQGAVTIMNVSDKIFADFTFRILTVSSKGKSRKVHHLHFTSWPDHSVPMYPQSVASYLKKLLATPPASGPIVVHCSAGVGRTGTIILSDICLRMAAAEGSVDMLGYLQQIREQRANLVDSLDQYKLVHLVLLECLVTEPSSYPCDAGFEKRMEDLINSGAMKTQFRRLSDIRWQDQALKSASKVQSHSPAETDPTKNRNLNIVPEPYCRVYISPFPYDEPNSDYINAVYVDGFRVKDQFIVMQFPLESTISDFWRLTSEKKVSLIVVLNEIDESICSFWPEEVKDSMKPIPQLTITKKQEDDALSWKTHTMSLVDSGVSRQVYILHLKGWKTNSEIPLPEDVMIGLWEEAERLYSGKDPIVVCCLDGASACGYFVALAFLIEKIKLEQQCDVCQAVRTVRQNREHFIPNIEQFESLYKAAVTYLESFQTYSNFS